MTTRICRIFHLVGASGCGTAISTSGPQNARRSQQMPHGGKITKGESASSRSTQTDAIIGSLILCAAQIAPVSWQSDADLFGLSVKTLVRMRPDAVYIAAAPPSRSGQRLAANLRAVFTSF